jgi:hypothetical protein
MSPSLLVTGLIRRDLIAFLRYINEAGCIGAVEWTRGHYPMAPLFRSRFFPYFRAVNLVSWTFNPDLSIQKIPAVYEVQI